MDNISKYIVFQLRDQSYGVNVGQVLSIERMEEITPVPKTSDFIKGIIHLRGETIPIIDLKERLALKSNELTDENRILIVSVDDTQVGFIVDAATDVLDIDDEVVEPAPNMVGGLKGDFMKGVAKLDDRLLILLDLSKVLDFRESNEVKQVETQATSQE